MRNFFIILASILLIVIQSFAQESSTLFREGVSYRQANKKVRAINKFEEALVKAEADDNVELQMRCHIELAELKDNVIYYKEALAHYREFSELYKAQTEQKQRLLQDSVNTLETEVEEGIEVIQEKLNKIDSLTTEQLKSELSIRDLELENERKKVTARESDNRKNILLLAVLIFAILAGFMMRSYIRKRRTNTTLQNKNEEIIKEKEKSDKLLLNILPKTVADELKEFGKTTSSYHESATVMFTDFKGFTQFSENHSPSDLVAMIDYYFSAFDEIISRYQIEKIKTIGDAYICVSGIPQANHKHIENMVEAAKEIIRFVGESVARKKSEGLPYLEIRIGIHTGPLVAGVVGSTKFAYDVWGDTVNIAARMEQSGQASAINVSETVYQALKDKYSFEYRGEIEEKNKGKLKMYFLSIQV